MSRIKSISGNYVYNITSFGVSLLDDVDAQSAQNTLGLAAAAADITLSNLTDYAAAANNLGYSRRNRLCNGDFRVDNINKGVAKTQLITDYPYICDNFRLGISQSSKLTTQRVVNSLTQFPYSMKITTASAFTPGASDYFTGNVSLEGFDAADFEWGAAQAKAITISFTVKVSVAGTYAFAVRNSAANRSYVFTKVLSTGENTVVQTIPGDTSGTWLKDNGVGLMLTMDIGCGSNYQTTAGSWQGVNAMSAPGCVQLVANAGATYEISGIQIEKGSFATPFEVLPYQQELAWCQRYHRVFGGRAQYEAIPGYGSQNSTTSIVISIPLHVPMRTAPSGVSISNAGHFYPRNQVIAAGNPCTAIVLDGGVNTSPDNVSLSCTFSPAGGALGYGVQLCTNTTSARLMLTGAEL